MLYVHDLHFDLKVQDINYMVADTNDLEVLNIMPRRHLCVKGNRLAQLGIPCLVKSVNDEALCFSLRRLECVLVGNAGTVYGFGFGADHTGRAVGDRFVVYRWAAWTGERCTESSGVVVLVHYEAGEVLFPPFLVKLYGIEELRWLLYDAI